MQTNGFNNQLDKAEKKLGFLTAFLTPILKMLDDKEFFDLPLRIFYYVIAIANLFIPLGAIYASLSLFFYSRYFPFWAWITIPIICLIIIVISAIIGVGSFAFWLRRYQDIREYNLHNRSYMSIRNFGLMQRTFGEWVGLIIIFLGIVDILTIFIPVDVVAGAGWNFLATNYIETIVDAICMFMVGYFVIFLAKAIYDWIEGYANKTADIRDMADMERMKMEVEE